MNKLCAILLLWVLTIGHAGELAKSDSTVINSLHKAKAPASEFSIFGIILLAVLAVFMVKRGFIIPGLPIGQSVIEVTHDDRKSKSGNDSLDGRN